MSPDWRSIRENHRGPYTALSTAHVPLSQYSSNGNDTVMSSDKTEKFREALLARIDQRLEGMAMSRRAASLKAFGKPDTIRNWGRKDKNVLPRMDSIEALAEVLETSATWLMYGGDDASPGLPPLKIVSSYDPENEEALNQDRTDWEAGENATAFVNGGLYFKGAIPGTSPEIPAAAGAGQGSIRDDRIVSVSSKGIASGHPVTSEWLIPPEFVRHSLGANPSQIVLIPVVGHSMEPRLYAGDRVMVDISQSSYQGDAIYVINDGDEVMKVKTLSKVAGSNPPSFRIVSEASPSQTDELRGDQFRIIGRVVGRFSRI